MPFVVKRKARKVARYTARKVKGNSTEIRLIVWDPAGRCYARLMPARFPAHDTAAVAQAFEQWDKWETYDPSRL